jgi:hypothetical protein
MTTGCSTINATIVDSNATVFYKVDKLDLCTVEGIPLKDVNAADTGANRVLGVNASLRDIPDNTCKVDASQPNGVYAAK